jgi:hypothetical protein
MLYHGVELLQGTGMFGMDQDLLDYLQIQCNIYDHKFEKGRMKNTDKSICVL